MKMIINNDTTKNHAYRIKRLITKASDIKIAVAFLKHEGLALLKESIEQSVSSGHSVSVVAGGDFGLTDPSALEQLVFLNNHNNCALYLADYLGKTTFHPKIYLFKGTKICSLIIGSANTTKAGLKSNKECSVLIDCTEQDTIWAEACFQFDSYIELSEKCDATVISKYRDYCKTQKRKHPKIDTGTCGSSGKTPQGVNKLIDLYYEFIRDEKEIKEYSNRLYRYQQAKEVLDSIADDTLYDENVFRIYLNRLVYSHDNVSYWHSGSLHRRKNEVYPHFTKFRQLVQQIRSDISKKSEIDTTFNNAKKLVKDIKGAGVNYITEIMMTYDYQNYPNLNANPITVLSAIGYKFKTEYSKSFTGAMYKEYKITVTKIINLLGLDNMLEVDSFINFVYWKKGEFRKPPKRDNASSKLLKEVTITTGLKDTI